MNDRAKARDWRAATPLILTQGDFLDIIADHQIVQADTTEELVNLLAEIAPQVMGQADIARMAITLTAATGRIHRFIDRINHLRHMDGIQLASEPVASARPSHTGDQSIAAQLGKQLFEIGQGYSLTLGNIRQRYRPTLAMQRQIKHRSNGITAFGCESHVQYQKFV